MSDAEQISKRLITDYGSKSKAMEIAISKAIEAGNNKDLYTLSIWRDVKRILKTSVTMKKS